MTRTLTGLPAWLVQRVSAVYMLLFIVFACLHFIADPPASYEAWDAWISAPAISIATLLFFAALLLHAWVGLRDVILDYVHPPAVRVCALVLLGLGLAAMAAWILQILLR